MTPLDLFFLSAFVLLYPIYYFLVHKFMDNILN